MTQATERADQILISELVASVIRNSWVVFVTTAIAIVLTGYYAFVIATPQFVSATKFELLEDNSGPSLGSASGLAALAGISLAEPRSEAAALQERILTRPFVSSIYDRAGFFDDPVFNGRLADPSFRTKVRRFIFGASESPEPTRDGYYLMAIAALKDRLTVNISENGIVEFRFRHPDSERAAEVANILVEQSLQDIFDRKRSEVRDSLNYFADELLQIRADLDAANSAVRDYAIENNLQSAEVLARTSTQLAQLRSDISELQAGLDVLAELRTFNADDFEGKPFSIGNPASTLLDLRRLLSWPSNPDAWDLPSSALLDSAEATYRSRQAALTRSLIELERLARISGDEALQLATLQREVQVQQSIYELVITQFETQSLFTGFEKASGRVLEQAIPPVRASEPRRLILVAMGILFGGFLGVVLALLVGAGRVYSRNQMSESFGLENSVAINTLQIPSLNRSNLSQKQASALMDVFAYLEEPGKVTAFLNTVKSNLALKLAVGLARQNSQSDINCAVIDFSGATFSGTNEQNENDAFHEETLHGVRVFRPKHPQKLMVKDRLSTVLDTMRQDYDAIFLVCTDINLGVAQSLAATSVSESVVIVSKRAKTRKRAIASVKSITSKLSRIKPLLVIV